MNHYVYRLDDPITNEFYIGSRSCKCNIKDDDYMGSYVTWKPEDKSRLVKTVLKSNFRKRETCIEYESKLIKECIDDVLNRNYHIPGKGFHVTGNVRSQETRKQISDTERGKVVSEEVKRKMSKAHMGKKLSEETKRKIGNSQRGIPRTEETRKKIKNTLMGHSVSAESRKKMSESRKGKTPSIETCRKLSEVLSGRPKSEETKRKMSIAKRNPTDETRRKLSKAMMGKVQKKITCPYCNKTGGNSNMKRYHFDNCKAKHVKY